MVESKRYINDANFALPLAQDPEDSCPNDKIVCKFVSTDIVQAPTTGTFIITSEVPIGDEICHVFEDHALTQGRGFDIDSCDQYMSLFDGAESGVPITVYYDTSNGFVNVGAAPDRQIQGGVGMWDFVDQVNNYAGVESKEVKPAMGMDGGTADVLLALPIVALVVLFGISRVKSGGWQVPGIPIVGDMRPRAEPTEDSLGKVRERQEIKSRASFWSLIRRNRRAERTENSTGTTRKKPETKSRVSPEKLRPKTRREKRTENYLGTVREKQEIKGSVSFWRLVLRNERENRQTALPPVDWEEGHKPGGD